VLLFLSCADFDIWPLTWFAIVPLFWIVFDEKTEKPWVYGFLCGLTANGGGFYWIVPFLQRFGHLPVIAAVPIFLLLIAYQAITFALFAHAIRKLRDHGGLPITFLAPVVYVAIELMVPYVFPWYLSITQAWVRPVIQVAELTGPLGVSFLLVLSNAALYEAIHAWRKKQKLPRRRLIAAASILVLSLGYGFLRIHQVTASRNASPALKVGVVQANIGIHEKWRPDRATEQLQLHQKLSADLEARGAELIVWPESSYPYGFRRDQTRDWPENDPRRARRGFSLPLFFGSLTAGGGARYSYNSALLLDKEGMVRGLFDKNILMVFGEYIPFYEQMRWFKRLIPATSHWSRGTDVTVFPLETRSGTFNLGPMICYEDIFPSFGRRLAKKNPNLLVNITNDAWFGRTSEPWEHMALSVYRAIELRLDLVRAVNTGVSTFIDSTGRVMSFSPSVDPQETPDAKPVALLDEVRLQQPLMLYATLGEWFGGACLLALLLIGLRARSRGGNPIRWPLVAMGAAVLLGAILLCAAIFAGPSRIGLALDLVAHRNLPPSLSPDVSFATGLAIAGGVLLGSLALGVVLTRKARAQVPLEAALAVLAVMVAPALALGTLEGEQAGLVIAALVAIALSRLSARFTRIK
jgi:apolipoprotein N-acyltransferase